MARVKGLAKMALAERNSAHRLASPPWLPSCFTSAAVTVAFSAESPASLSMASSATFSLTADVAAAAAAAGEEVAVAAAAAAASFHLRLNSAA